MIRHSYTQCQSCHVDPSGSGVLTPYGRATGDVFLPIQWGEPRSGDDPSAQFLWGAAPLPNEIALGGDIRVMRLSQKVGEAPLQNKIIYMQLDAEAGLITEHFVASASIGFAPEGALGAALTRGTDDNLTSRQHWLGYAPIPGSLMIRGGRMNLPFGIRSIEHTLWTRAFTRTSINDDQQYGLSLAFETPILRGELMAIAGNLQLRPGEYREQGYAGYVEWPASDRFVLGASSLLTHRDLDPRRLRKTFHQAHGLMARWQTPFEPLVVLTEWDYALESPEGQPWRNGFVGYAQADLEPLRGIHFLVTFEANNIGTRAARYSSYGTWLSYAWFFAPHADLRLDGIYQSIGGPERIGAWVFLSQAHVYL